MSSNGRIIQFEVDNSSIIYNLFRLEEMIKSQVINSYPNVFNNISNEKNLTDILNDPALIYQVMNGRIHKSKIDEILFIYSEKTFLEKESDSFGTIYIPLLGFIQVEPYLKVKLEKIDNDIIVNTGVNKEISFRQIMIEEFEISPTIPQILIDNKKAIINEPISATIPKYLPQLRAAIELIKDELPFFFELIKTTTRQFCIYNAQGADSFASINYQGTCFINTYNKEQSIIFFLDDISHQCGHIIFNLLTIDTNEYLKYPKNTSLNKFTNNSNDSRTIYSAFHGLFTYTCILNTLKTIIDTGLLDESERFETLARIGFYTIKFGMDLNHFKGKGILTQNGEFFFDQFVEGYKMIYNKFINVLQDFKYHNQPYVFDMDAFHKVNRFKIFE